MELITWLEVEADWKNMPKEVLDAFNKLVNEYDAKLRKQEVNIRTYDGTRNGLLDLGFETIEEIPHGKKYFTIMNQYVKDDDGILMTDWISGIDYLIEDDGK
ncbi:MAG: hypothetical protein Ta2E_08220 [Mycoplasmoidaceae bacterium]|nr:MAG: hypothetical protein Ta2E_08220 [Mycoplasmoidaceae bacterium]